MRLSVPSCDRSLVCCSDELVIKDLRLFALAALIAYLGPFGLASPADAQQGTSPRRIGVVAPAFSVDSQEAQAFREGLR